ncbi:MAG TPA: hypothetical protein VJ063_10625, partial [Verrucomicrobiae bacterium]|nr:hypothetical protein [Verrucomicrobiae bacterium]
GGFNPGGGGGGTAGGSQPTAGSPGGRSGNASAPSSSSSSSGGGSSPAGSGSRGGPSGGGASSGGGLFSQVESALGSRAPAQPAMTPNSRVQTSRTITRTQEFVMPETIALATKSNTVRAPAIATNKPPPELAVEPPAAPPEEFTPLFAAYVEPKDATNLLPIFLIMLLIVLTVELMRRHRRRRKRRWVPT